MASLIALKSDPEYESGHGQSPKQHGCYLIITYSTFQLIKCDKMSHIMKNILLAHTL